MNAFRQLYSGLDREGPGTAGDVRWRLGLAQTGQGARIARRRPGATGALRAVLKTSQGEIDAWRAAPDRIACARSVVEPA
tara:strand:- start:3694 stop:3933 length:240 start_codon:yes stop_codon:yes gene_type:complete